MDFNPDSLTTTFGSNLLGVFLASILYGVTCFLTITYFRRYPNDRMWFKCMVGILWLLDTLHSVFSMHYCYHYLVRRFDEPEAMSSAVWLVSINHVLAIVEELMDRNTLGFNRSLQLTILITAFPPFISNSFYLSRLYKIGQKNVLLIGGIGLLILARLGIELAASVLLFIHPVFRDFLRYTYLVKAFCSISSAADILLAVFITWNLHKRRTGYHRTDMTIDLIIVYIFSTGILTSIICTLSLLSVILIDGGLVDIALHAVLGKLYITSVLAVLNSRPSQSKRSNTLYEVSAFGVDSTMSESSTLLRTKLSSSTFLKSGGGTSTLDAEKKPQADLDVHASRV